MGRLQDILNREREIEAREKALLEKEKELGGASPPPELTPVFSPGEKIRHSAKGHIGKVTRVARNPKGFLYHVQWSEGPAREGACRKSELVSAESVAASSGPEAFVGEPQNEDEFAEWWAKGWRPSNMCKTCPDPKTPCEECWVRAGYNADRYPYRALLQGSDDIRVEPAEGEDVEPAEGEDKG